MTRRSAVAALLGAPLFAGCGGERPAEVTGTVKIDGKPLPEGEIIFEAADGSKAPGAAPIRDGAYTVSVMPGPKKVKVTASRPPKKRDPVLGDTAREPMVGPEYNDRSTLTADVKPGKNADVNFEVKELPK
ncbi:MAG: hypothetical protein J0I06_19505 [Planctomycetes bacterium]|nr:hypothetical protein [Planctomycetota bacterium]